jgi:CubicO group peptidase (beta-lactamase class C family)
MSRLLRTCFAAAFIAGLIGASSSGHAAAPAGPAASAPAPGTSPADLDRLVSGAMAQYRLKAILVQVSSQGRTTYLRTRGESMAGVAAAPAMHFRNGAFAFTYMSTLLMELVDRHVVSLDEKLAKFLPDLPDAGKISLKNLADMTSGYADYVYQPQVLGGTTRDPFRHWTSQELIRIGTGTPMLFAPGSNWAYSHTNYVILGRVLELATHMKLADALRQYVLQPMHLTDTKGFDTPVIPEPVLHAFSSERRADLGIPAAKPFYEESTYWNPSWTTAEGAVETTSIADLVRTMIDVGTGRLLSKASFAAQVGPNLVGFGHSQPGCAACRANTTAFNYGLGVLNLGPWVTQTKSFAGSAASAGYLASHGLAIAVVTTNGAGAYDAKGDAVDASGPTFASIANLMAPDARIAMPK